MAPWIKFLMCKQQDRSSDPQCPHKIGLVGCTYKPRAGREDKEGLRNLLPVSLAKMVDSRFRRDPVLKIKVTRD